MWSLPRSRGHSTVGLVLSNSSSDHRVCVCHVPMCSTTNIRNPGASSLTYPLYYIAVKCACVVVDSGSSRCLCLTWFVQTSRMDGTVLPSASDRSPSVSKAKDGMIDCQWGILVLHLHHLSYHLGRACFVPRQQQPL